MITALDNVNINQRSKLRKTKRHGTAMNWSQFSKYSTQQAAGKIATPHSTTRKQYKMPQVLCAKKGPNNANKSNLLALENCLAHRH